MTQRSILAGINPTVIIKAGVDVTVKGVDGETVTAESTSKWGLKVEKHSEAEFARARAAVGEVVLFDLRLKKPSFGEKNTPEEVIEVQLGGSGEVQVPYGSNIKVYAGKDIDVRGIHGRVDVYSGFRLNLQDVASLGNASAGGSMNIDCQMLLDEKVEFKAGGDIRLHVQNLDSAFIRVKDLGGFWEARIGGGLKPISLKCGGDVTLVTDEKVEALPPNYVLGKIEKPAAA